LNEIKKEIGLGSLILSKVHVSLAIEYCSIESEAFLLDVPPKI